MVTTTAAATAAAAAVLNDCLNSYWDSYCKDGM